MTTEAAPSSLNGPNVLTSLRLLVVPVFAWMLLAHGQEQNWRIWTTVVFVLAILTDMVDGWWARRANLVTNFGKIADPIADKAITGMAFVGLSILGELSWVVTIIILVREWGITLMRFLLLRRGIVLAANRGGKLKTVLQAVALALYLLPLPAYAWGTPLTLAALPEVFSWLVMALATIVTVITGIDYVRGAFDQEKKQP
ncbi:MAG TPA: CDP-diacylglycerol--glycerol-3-phosphate 3-phosphatidyltransferase [Propionibacterium sp.]|jgi:CDP-diacylglycerol--glycerol-3-phosphate 3-phosphatidyltransferase|nr:CDP-diacylglycerol--glycerol-3-phosphate 3-phosphatidyltransferase [Propionibacterium sp.]